MKIGNQLEQSQVIQGSALGRRNMAVWKPFRPLLGLTIWICVFPVIAHAEWPPAPVERSGQNTCTDENGFVVACEATGQDGDLRTGIAHPSPRFTDNSDGTVTDNLTALVWLQDANCNGTMTWQDSLDWANRLADGCSDCGGIDNDCGLSDGSQPGDWRLTNMNELRSLVNFEYYGPSLPNTSGDGQWSEGGPFNNVSSLFYHTSTSWVASPADDLIIDLFNGTETWVQKTGQQRAWAVRGGDPGAVDRFPAPVEATGQTTCYDDLGAPISCDNTGQDGDVQAGIALPSPRFTDNGDGTVTDDLTGLSWLGTADCFGETTWQAGLDWANRLADGCSDCGGVDNDCGLSDGSQPGSWRLANTKELQSLVHFEYVDPCISNTNGDGQWAEGDPFTDVQNNQYFTSTTYMDNPVWAFYVSFADGNSEVIDKTLSLGLVWAVRGGPIFRDGFETGSTSGWSASVP